LNHNDHRLLEKQVALLESLVIKITQSNDGPVAVKSSSFSADYDRNKSVDVNGGMDDERNVDGMVMNSEERNQRNSNRDWSDERNTSSKDVSTDSRDIDRKLSNISNDAKKDRSSSNDVKKDRSSTYSDRNSNSDSGRQSRGFSVLSLISKVINKVSTTGAALSEQEERIELARKSGRLLRGVSGALVKTASNTVGFWVGLGFEEEGEKTGRKRRIADDAGYDDAYSRDDDYRNRNFGNNNSTNISERERGSPSAIDNDDNDYIDIKKIIDSDLSFSDQSNRDSASFETTDPSRNRKNSNINDSIDDILGSIG
jgi:hypothetical protein